MRRVPTIVLALMMLINFGRGCIHAFAPDGGAHSIAGLDLSQNGQTILSLFAVMGFQQIVMGLFQLYVLAWRRELVAVALALQTIETAFGVANLYFYRPMPVPVPGAPFNAVLLALLVAATALAFARPSQSAAR
ncbi:MAG TPA: hypothetical protein VMJ73_13050 [Rhizomicrobium sp.]|nr:hypothetical protein [Rhizomicrobium sp.]